MRVYHFLSLQNALSDIALCRIRVSRYHELNDPYELMAANVGPPAIRSAVKANREGMEKEAGILCFTKEYKRPILWSHYADKHRGVCLGFDLRDDVAVEVKYVRERVPLVSPDGKSAADDETINSMLFSKDADWNYEGEVRVHIQLRTVPIVEDGQYFLPLSSDLALQEVILGARCPMPSETVRKLVDRCHEGVAVRNAALAFKWFSVVAD